jgi:hypothetical protein
MVEVDSIGSTTPVMVAIDREQLGHADRLIRCA